uniref:Solute carrier organic anion transporter family member n=1 Tax=Hucho hucho TaxID=62062 RepID=A0A4W5KHJ9_9TELE
PQNKLNSYFKSTITTIERRFGLSSFSSGTVSSLHEVGRRSHSWPAALQENRQDLCSLQDTSNMTEACGMTEIKRIADTNNLWLLMAIAQLLFGVGSVPIQPFGISYVDDFAGRGNSPLYIAILFAVSVFGPAFGFLLGSVMLRIYVDVDRTGSGRNCLAPTDPRWVGAWWMGLLISSASLALTSTPYFFFPRSMPLEGNVGNTLSLSLHPKWDPIPYTGPICLWSNVLHYVGNRVAFVMHTDAETLHTDAYTLLMRVL